MFHDRETWQHLKKSRASRTPERHAKQGRRPFFFSFSLLSGFTITSTSSSLLSKSREGGRSYRQETQSRFCTPPPSPTQKKNQATIDIQDGRSVSRLDVPPFGQHTHTHGTQDPVCLFRLPHSFGTGGDDWARKTSQRGSAFSFFISWPSG